METEFTPLQSLLGGALIGLSAVWLMASTGRIAGISGIVSRLLPPGSGASGAGLAFVAGLLLAGPIYVFTLGQSVPQHFSVGLPMLAVAGLLVGFGSAYGSGCTSGHGVCGISRLSGRSIVATCTFMATGFVTVFIVRHVMGG